MTQAIQDSLNLDIRPEASLEDFQSSSYRPFWMLLINWYKAVCVSCSLSVILALARRIWQVPSMSIILQ